MSVQQQDTYPGAPVDPEENVAPVNEPVQSAGPNDEVYEDYWGTDEKHEFYLPDGKQYFVFQIMDEGAKARFQRKTNQDISIGRDNTAKVRMDPASERHTLIKESVVDWYLYKDGRPVAFDNGKLEKWLSVAPPKIVEDLELAIRKANPWMQAEMTVEMIDEQIRNLEDLRRDAVAREAGEGSSANK
jgi:hypothetical protein